MSLNYHAVDQSCCREGEIFCTNFKPNPWELELAILLYVTMSVSNCSLYKLSTQTYPKMTPYDVIMLYYFKKCLVHTLGYSEREKFTLPPG